MLIGILSDTHNDDEMTRSAIDAFRGHGVDLIIHAGDIGSREIIDLFKGSDTRFVLGNCDTNHDEIASHCRICGHEPAERCTEFEIDSKRFFVCHGDNLQNYRDAIDSGRYDYLIYGHTHEFIARHKGNTMVINPGAVTRDLHSDILPSVAILDLETGEVEKITL